MIWLGVYSHKGVLVIRQRNVSCAAGGLMNAINANLAGVYG